jgi:hypothetical protein
MSPTARGPIVISESATVEPVDLEAVMRAIFNPGLTPLDLAEALVTTLDALLLLFIPENADRSVGELVGHV